MHTIRPGANPHGKPAYLVSFTLGSPKARSINLMKRAYWLYTAIHNGISAVIYSHSTYLWIVQPPKKATNFAGHMELIENSSALYIAFLWTVKVPLVLPIEGSFHSVTKSFVDSIASYSWPPYFKIHLHPGNVLRTRHPLDKKTILCRIRKQFLRFTHSGLPYPFSTHEVGGQFVDCSASCFSSVFILR